MFRRVGLVLVWVVAAIAATGTVFAAVSSVTGGVVDRPGPALEAVLDEQELPGGAAPSSSTSIPGSSSTSPTVTSTTFAGTSTSVTSTSVTSPGSTATSAAPEATEKTTYQLVGGWVRIAYGPGIVKLDGAGPHPGFTMDVKDPGPDDVEVEFRSTAHRSSVEVDWADGRLHEEIEERD